MRRWNTLAAVTIHEYSFEQCLFIQLRPEGVHILAEHEFRVRRADTPDAEFHLGLELAFHPTDIAGSEPGLVWTIVR